MNGKERGKTDGRTNRGKDRVTNRDRSEYIRDVKRLVIQFD